MRPNRLQLNTAKTEVLWSTSSRRLRLLPVSPIRCPQLRRLHYADVSMRSHVSKTVTAFLRFCVNCGVFVGNRRSVPRSVLQSLVSSLVLQRLDYGNAILADIPSHPTKRRKRMQSVLKSAARLVFSASRYDRITSLPTQLHSALASLSWLFWYTDAYTRQHRRTLLRNSISHLLTRLVSVSALHRHHRLLSHARTCLSTIGDRAFPVAAARLWNTAAEQ